MSTARYRISRRLGQGGMAEVFEAELAGELGFVRKVAIKRMLAEAASDHSAAQRFLDEARIASRLHHANIVSVLDVGLLDGLPFHVLELVDGLNALQLMQRGGGKLPLPVALLVATDVAHALDHAHGATDDAGVALGIVHRDVKPANVLVSWAGDVKLGDFGIALAHDRTSRTEAGLVAGTLGFMAPEQRTRGSVDGRADVFALGLTLHALIAGYTPLQDVAVEMASLVGDRIPLSPDLPDDIARLIASTVTFDRNARPTAAQLADALGAAVATRIARDPRSVLREHLASLEGATAKRGALDQLLGLDVVMTNTPQQAGPAHYELRPADITPTIHAKPKPDIDPEASTALRETDVVRRPRTGRRIGIVAIAGAAVGVGAWQLAAHRDSDPPVASAPVDAAVFVDAAKVAAAPDASALDAAVAVVTPDAAPPRDAAIVAVVHRDAGQPDAPRMHGNPPPPRFRDADVAAGTGYLQVVGEDMIGGRVLVDGIVRGYPPAKIEVARGHHTIVVEKKDGTRVSAQVDITDLDTVAKPLRPSF